MSFLTPTWLFALAALCIPVTIHLWNIKPGKTLKVGSIALFSESSPKSSRSFKLQDILLLAMRCLLLALIAFLLAAPYLQRLLNDKKAKGWVLIPEVNLMQTYHRFQPQIDSLTKAGYEFHYFRSDFKKADLAELLKVPADSTVKYDTLNYWILTRQLGQRISPSLPVALFTPNTANHFTGSKPQTPLAINWHTYTPADSVSNRTAGAWLTAAGDIRIVQGNATTSGTNYQYINIKNGNTAAGYRVDIENGVPVITSVNNPEDKLSADTATKRIAIYADKNPIDANYLRSALEAAAQLMQQKTVIKQYAQMDAIPAGQDWLFWLSDKPISADIKSKNIFRYQGGKIADVNSQLSNTDNLTIQQSLQQIPLYKIVKSNPVGENVWSDGFGDAVLSKETGQINTYHFYSRFNPTWSDLVWSDEFPKWLLELTNNLQFKSVADKRIISAAQLQPVHINIENEVFVPQTDRLSLVNYLWIALALVFIAERWLATKNNTVIANG